MKTVIFYFTERGQMTAQAVQKILGEEAECVRPLHVLEETRKVFPEVRALIFIGACGIAVRAIAPCLKGKDQDPAVLVLDEEGHFVISLLSGHLGGANTLTRSLAKDLGAQPVITTASDVRGRFSADAWAGQQGMRLSDLSIARQVSSAMLRTPLPLQSDFPIDGQWPNELTHDSTGPLGIYVTARLKTPYEKTLRLIPPVISAGIGCRRGTDKDAILQALQCTLADLGLDSLSLFSISSIDLKKEEPGLLASARELNVPLQFYSAQQLNQLVGDFSYSEFVRKTTGTDNVCERAALMAAGPEAVLVCPKRVFPGLTVAVAERKWRCSFDGY